MACSSAGFARSPAQLKARRIAARLGSARLAIRDSAHLGSWLGLGLGLGWGLGDQLNARLGSARSSARVQLEARLGIGWEIGIRFGLAQGSAGLTCLGLMLGIGSGLGSAWRPGPPRRSTNIPLHPQYHFQSFTHAVNMLYLVRTFFFSPIIYFLSERCLARACSFAVDCWGFSRSLLRISSHWVERIPESAC